MRSIKDDAATAPRAEPAPDPHPIERDLAALGALLEAESAALRAQGPKAAAALSEIAAQKVAVVARLQAATPPDAPGAARERPTLTPELAARLEQIRQLNRRNGALVELRAQHVDRLLAILHGVDEAAQALKQTYDASGGAVRAAPSARYRAEA